MNLKYLIPSLAVLLIGTSGAQTITVDGSATFTSSPNDEIVRPAGRIYTFTNAQLGGFDATASDKLVVAFSSEGPGTIESVTYAGAPLTPAIVSSTFRVTAIYYLDNPAANGDLVFDFTGGNGVGGSLLSLSNTVAGVANSSTSPGSSTSLATPADDSLVVAAVVINGGNAPTAVAPLTGVFSQPVGSASGATGYQQVASTSTVSPAFSAGETTAAAAFAPDVADLAAPQIVSSDPAHQGADIRTDPSLLVVQFNEAVQAGTGSIAIRELSGDTPVASFDVSSAPELDFSGNTLTITPGILLAPSTAYYVDIPAGTVEDGSGNSTAYGSSDWSFTTGAVPTRSMQSEADQSIYTFDGTLDLLGFDPGSADKLVVHVSSKAGAPVASLGVTFGGTPLSEAIGANSSAGNIHAALFYLDNPPAGGNLELTFDDTRNGVAVSLYALTGTVDGVGDTSASVGTNSTSVLVAADGSFVIGSNAFSGGSGSTPAAPLVPVLDTAVANVASHGSGYVVASPAGPYTASFPDAPAGTSTVTLAAGFELDTGDATAPTLTASTPADGASGLNIFNAALTLTFSEPVKAGTGNISLLRSADDSVLTTIDIASDWVGISGDTVTVMLGNLEYDTGYYVNVDATALTDLVNLPFAGISDTTTLGFSTAAKPTGTINVDLAVATEDEANASIYTFSSMDLGGFDPTSSDKLVVHISSEGGAAVSALTATYGGASMNIIASGNSASDARHHAAILYLDNPTVAGDLVIDHGVSRSGVALSAVALTNTTAGVAVTAPAGFGSSTTLTTNAANSLVFAANVFNGGSGSVPQPPLTTVLSLENGSASHGSGYQQVPGAGTEVTPTFSGGAVTLAAAFALDGPSGGNNFSTWIAGFNVGGLTGLNDDPDGDGIDNGVENLFGTAPDAFSQGLVAGVASGNAFSVTHPQGTLADDLSAGYRWSTDLQNFLPDGATDGNGTTVEFSATTDGGITTVTATVTAGPVPSALFVDVEVTQD